MESEKSVDPRVFKNPSAGSSAGLGGAYGGHPVSECAQQCASESYGNARSIIGRLIDYHNRQANWLCALERALPREMSREAEQGLYELAKAALGRI